jgi:hypothetical protein
MTNDPLRYANAWIRLYWLYSDHSSFDFAKQAAKEALKYFTRYSNHGASSMVLEDKMRLNAIMAELSFALEDYERAFEEYNNNIIMAKDTKSNLFKEYVRRRDELKVLIR